MATSNSQPAFRASWALILGVWLAAAVFAKAGEGDTNIFAARAEAEFHRTQKQFQSDTNDVTTAWKFARACFDFADFATNDAERANIARQGIAASRQAIACASNSAPAHYYLGQNLGQLARTETLGALKIVREMEREFKTAIRLDGHFDYAGPERSLGLLYRDAPGWPASIGSRHKAREWLKKAEKLAPAYPENHLNLIESYLEWHEHAAAKHELQVLDALWPVARTNLAGPTWEPSWADWSTRREAARKRLDETSRSKESPKNTH
jgi:tetratricopeptide (TPR) repeat protein